MKRSQLLVALGLAALAAAPAAARDQIRIVGSSTVYPFSTAVAEQFGRTREFKTPVVESTGTGGGMKLFCAGVGDATPTSPTARGASSRASSTACTTNGVDDRRGEDRLRRHRDREREEANPLEPHRSTRSSSRSRSRCRTDGKLVPNPYTTWKDIDASLPARQDRGTRAAADFGHARRLRGARRWRAARRRFRCSPTSAKTESRRSPPRSRRRRVRRGRRERQPDRPEARGESARARRVRLFVPRREHRQGARRAIIGVLPTFDSISDGDYGISRALYFYVKKAHVGKVPGLKEFIAAFLSDAAASADGYLADKGLIPLEDAERAAVRKSAVALTAFALK